MMQYYNGEIDADTDTDIDLSRQDKSQKTTLYKNSYRKIHTMIPLMKF